MKALIIIGGVVVVILIAAGVYFLVTRVRIAPPDTTPNKKRSVTK